MTIFQANNETNLINYKFGLITDKQVIITKGFKKSKVPFNSINRVNLIKSNVFYLNILLLLLRKFQKNRALLSKSNLAFPIHKTSF